MTALTRAAQFVVPAYFHPTTTDWQTLARMGPSLAFAIMNPDSGPGREADPRYLPAIDAVHEAGGHIIGYIDTAYARRPGSAVLDDAAIYRSRYRLNGVFLDQVSSGPAQIAHYRRIIHATRRLGIDVIVINPGVVPAPEYAEMADVVVIFEGPWSTYGDHEVDPWMKAHPSDRFCHLVYGTPIGALDQVMRHAADHHTGLVYATELTGTNPWSELCTDLRSAFSPQSSP